MMHIREKLAGILLSDRFIEYFIYYTIFLFSVILGLADYLAFGHELSRRSQIIFMVMILPVMFYTLYFILETKVSD